MEEKLLKTFLEKMEEIMDLDEGTLSMDSKLDEFDEWDSLSALGLTVFVKQNFEKVLTTSELREFVLVSDIYKYCYGG